MVAEETVNQTTGVQQEKPKRKKQNPINKIFVNLFKVITGTIIKSIKGISNLITTFFKLVMLITSPIDFIIAIVQLAKSRAFSTVVLIGSLIVVAYASLDSTKLVLSSLFPEWTEKQIGDYSFRIIVFLETVLVYFKVTRKVILSWVAMILVFAFTMGSIGYDVILNYEKMGTSKLIVFGFVMVIPTLLSTLLMYASSTEVAKIPKNTKLDKAFKGKSRTKRHSLSKEERETLNKQILEYCDYNGSANIESFRQVQSVFQDRVKTSGYISNLLEKERPIMANEIRSKQKSGRKSDAEVNKEAKKTMRKFFSNIFK